MVNWIHELVNRLNSQTPVVPKLPTTTGVVLANGAVVSSSTDTVLSPKLTTATSGRPSPLKSAAATLVGKVPAAKVCWVAKDDVPDPAGVVFTSTEIVLSFWLATAR